MRWMIAAAAFAFATIPALAQEAPAAAGNGAAIPFREMIAGAVENYARPKFAALAAAAGTLQTDVSALCAEPSIAGTTVVEGAFKDTVIAYSEVEFLRMGPLNVDERVERLLFWPDTKGIALRQIQQALAAEDPTATDPATLKDKSVAMQGLFAIEYLLFGTGANDLASSAGAYRCRYAAAATALLAELTATLSTEWADTRPGSASDAMLNPKAGSPDYRTELEVINKLAATLSFASDTIRDQRLSPILSFATGTPKPRSALFWRSGMTAKALAANFTGISEFFAAAKFPEALSSANAWIGQGIDYEFRNAIAAAALVPAQMDLAVTTSEGQEGLKQMYVSTGSLDTLYESLGTALGLSTGFSTLDGD